MWRLSTILISFAVLIGAGCAGSKAKAQEQVLECDVLFEYQFVENDSISLMVGNTIRLHTGKAMTGAFYPLLLSIRDPQDLDKPTNTEVIGSEEQLFTLLQGKFPYLKRIGVVIGESAYQQSAFAEKDALLPIRGLVKRIPEAELLLFQEKGGEIVGVQAQ